jgi:hypothetical protein
LAIAALILWVLTASAGVSLLSSGRAARSAAPGSFPSAGTASAPAPSAGAAGAPAQKADAADGTAPASLSARLGAIPLTEDGKPPPVPHAKVTAPPGEHPLLQFCHPALALIGFGFWLAFVFVHYRPLAWVSFGVLLVTIGAGLSWLTGNALAARRQHGAAPALPSRLIVLHGLAAAATLTLTVLTALTATHG